MKARARAAWIATLPWLLMPPLLAFGDRGHRVVGEIAAVYLTPEARRHVADLLDGRTLADVSNEPDRWREARPETGPWHYVNLPPGADGFDWARDVPPQKCVVERIEHFRRVLADGSADRAARAEALIWLTHLIGDLHQPLHVALRADRGGNDLLVRIGPDEVNLHRVFDEVLLERQGLEHRDYAHELLAEVHPAEVAAWCGRGLIDWTNESWRLANQLAYTDPGGRRIRSGDRLGRTWILSRTAMLEVQLQKAGVRLASMLNGALDPPVPAGDAGG